MASSMGDATTSTASDQATEKLTVVLNAGFGVGAMGVAILANRTATLLPPFMTNFLGIGAGMAATILLVTKLYDVVTDPLMGVISDRTRTPWGRRRPYLFLGGVVGALGLVLLFVPPELDNSTYLISYILVALLLSFTGYTLFNVPHLAMAAEMTRNYHARTILMTYRTGFMMTGGLIAAASFALVQWLGNDRAAHAPVALLFGGIMFLACSLCFLGTASAEQTKKSSHTYSIAEQVRSALGNRPYVLLLAAKLCQLFGISSAGTMAIYFKVGVLKLDYAFISSYIMVVTIFSIAALPVWARSSKALGKRHVYMIAIAGYALVTLSWLLASPGDPNISYYIRGACLGVCAAGILVLGPALLPDTIEYDYLKTGLRREGIFASFYTTMEKLAYAIGPSVILLVLGWYGYESGTEGLSVDQPQSAVSAIYACAAVVPAVLCLLSIGILRFYDLSEKELERLREQSRKHSN